MADFVAVLKKTLDGLGDPTPATRERVYEKARATVAAKLAALSPPPPAGVADRQKRALDDAIATIEKEYAAAAAAISDPLAELENVFASLKNPQPKALGPQPSAKPEAWPKTTPAAPVAKPANGADRAPPPLPAAAPVDIAADDQHGDFETGRVEESSRRSYGGLLVAALLLAVLAGGGYGIWLNKDAFGDMFGLGEPETATAPPAAEPVPVEPAPPMAAAPAEAPVPATAPGEDGKFTQRLTPEGTEIDPGPGGGETGIGEGTSVAALTQPPPAAPAAPAAPSVEIAPADPAAPPAMVEAAPADPTAPAGAGPTAPADPAAPPAGTPAVPPAATQETTAAAPTETAVPVGQKAIFYEERTNSAEGSAEPGSIVWSLIQESPGANLPPEPAIRAEATIPGKDVQLRMTIKRNADQTLPASHIIEMIFLTPDGFEGGGIENILRVAMKGSEQEAGNPLIGIPAKIADGFFLVALNDTKAEIDANMTLLRRQSWIDVPVVYKSGRRALFTMEKGVPGDKVFDEALKAWQAASAG
jgi:hypothetical protein